MRAHAPEREGSPLARVFGAWLLLMSAIAMLALLVWACAAIGKASHEGWPRINGVLLMNSKDESRPLTGRPNAHNELLGGHGSDTIVAGRVGDVIWGDYKPCCQPTTQVDHLYGGPGRDHIYASHGFNMIRTGGGRDVVYAHFGRGEIHCDSPNVMLYISHRSRKRYRLYGCKRISYKTERMRRAERR